MHAADGHIIDKCLNGDSDAFGLLVDKYKAGIFALAYGKVGNPQDAEDITQEAFLKAYRKLRTLRRLDDFFAWLYSITVNLCKDWVQTQSRRPDREYIEDPDNEILQHPSVNTYREGLVYESLYDALGALPEMYRQVLTLHYLGGMKSREIAQFLGRAKNTVDTRLRRARLLLKEEMITMMKKVLEQIQPTPGGSTFIGTLYPVLQAAGGDWSITRLQGTFGHAFSFSMKKGGEEVWQQANIDWWLLWDMLDHIGYEFHEFDVALKFNQPVPSPQELQELKDETWEKVKASIDCGIPAIAWQSMTVEQRDSGIDAYEWGLLVGYDEAKKTYTVRHKNHTTGYTVPYDKFGYTDSVNWYCVFVLGSPKPFDQMAVEVKSLENAVAFADGTRYKKVDACYDVDAVGFAAYELWKEAFETGEVNLQFALGHARILRSLRQSAAAYLREIADHFPAGASGSLFDAAAFYEQEVEVVSKLVEICLDAKEGDGFTTSMLQDAVTTLNDALNVDRKAIAKIETALAVLP